jgi:L-fucose mutarotase
LGRSVAALRHVDPINSAELLYVLMGRGDDIVVCDVNHPAVSIAKETTYGKLVSVTGCKIPALTKAILLLMPLDDFVEQPVMRMRMVGSPNGVVPIFGEMQKTLDECAGKPVNMGAYDRFDFYAAARKSFAIVRTSGPGPYGCFIIRKGVINAS